MKTALIYQLILAILFFSWPGILKSQENYSQRRDISPFGTTEDELRIGLGTIKGYEYITQFTYFDMNFSYPRLQLFLQNKMGMGESVETKVNWDNEEKLLSDKYVEKIQSNHTEPRSLNVNFVLYSYEGLLIIKSCEISGYYQYIKDLYLKYWPTAGDIDLADSGQKVICYFQQDKVELTLDPKKKSGKIYISSTTIKNIEEFKTIVQANKEKNEDLK